MNVSPTPALFLLVLLGGCLAIDVAGVAVAIRLWRARPPGAPLRSGTNLYLGFTIVATGLALLAVVRGALCAIAAAGGESVDPSQKARILAEGLSEAINNVAFAPLAATPLAIAILIYARVRRSRESDPQRR